MIYFNLDLLVSFILLINASNIGHHAEVIGNFCVFVFAFGHFKNAATLLCSKKEKTCEDYWHFEP